MELSSTGNKATIHNGFHALVCALLYRYALSNTSTPKQLLCHTRQGLPNIKFTLKVFCGSYQNELTSLCIQKGGVLAGNPAVPTKLLLLPTLVICLVG